MKSKVIVVYSGGMDSTVLLSKLAAEGHEVRALSVNYGQRHSRELQAATKICKILNVEHKIIDLSGLKQLMAGSSQTDDTVAVPHGNYDAPTMALTVVPNRNAILLMVAGAWAISTKSDAVTYAAHAGDHAQYADCRNEFVEPLAEALLNADWHHVSIERPFLKMNKAQIAKLGDELDNLRLMAGSEPVMGLSYSCYEGGEVHCGGCGTCRERRSAYHEAGVEDPTPYKAAGLAEAPLETLPKL